MPAGIPSVHAASSGDLVHAEDLRFSYPGGGEVLGGISFSLGRGDIAFLTGPNGAGKTTLAKLLAGLLTPSSGEILLDGHPYRSMTSDGIASHVGLTFQNAALHLSRGTVRGEFALAERWGRPAWRWAEVFGLDHLFDRHPLELTRAGIKRLATALAAGGNPNMIVLDEPSQYQDEEGFRILAEGIGLIAAGGTAVFVITHDPRLYTAFPAAKRIPVGGTIQGGVS
jgi:energy-coupling factor transporter ATP-binding protein EcfA2